MVNLVPDVPNTGSRETRGRPRKVLGSNEFRVLNLMDQVKRAKQDAVQGDKNLKMIKRKEKGDWIRTGKIFPVMMRSVISGVFGHKKTQTDGDCDQRDHPRMKQPSKTTKNLHEIRRVSSSILILGRRLKTRKNVWDDSKGEEELCKKRILMGGKCKPLNRSGTLQYDGDGVLLPEP